MKSTFKTRRDMCYSVGRRAAALKPQEAAAAWQRLATLLGEMGEKDIPKFKDMLAAVRFANIHGKQAGKVTEDLKKALCEYQEHHRPKLHTDLPDSDLTVLLVTTDSEYPVWVGFHDGETWRSASADTLEGPIVGWLHLHEAAELLRGRA
jgi:hypothetical protein